MIIYLNKIYALLGLCYIVPPQLSELQKANFRANRLQNDHIFTAAISHRDHPYITSAKGLDGWGRDMAIFDDNKNCINADIVGGWVRKSPKIC